MSFTTGTATDYHDLLDRLRKWMTGIGQPDDPTFTGTGNGTMTDISASSSAVTETWTITCTATATDGGTFSVTGSVSGAQTDATVGTPYNNGLIAFTINDGSTDFALNDEFSLSVTGSDLTWSQLRWTAPASLTDTAELWIRGPGAGPDRQVFVGIRSSNNLTLPAYGWDVRGAISFDTNLGFVDQQGVSPGSWFNTWDSLIDYWFYGNDRRFMIVAKVSTVYVHMYAGFFLPFALPSEYPFPLYVSGNYSTLAQADVDQSGNRMFIDPGINNATYRRHTSASWHVVSNVTDASGTGIAYPGGTTSEGRMWPHATARTTTTGSQTSAWQVSGFDRLRPTNTGERPIWQSHILDPGVGALVGALDGAFALPGFSLATEQLLTANGRSFDVFQNVARSSNRDFIAIERL